VLDGVEKGEDARGGDTLGFRGAPQELALGGLGTGGPAAGREHEQTQAGSANSYLLEKYPTIQCHAASIYPRSLGKQA
jgi:hypothetical protein